MLAESTTLFESLFPLLALQTCLSTSRGSTNGPRYSATDRTTSGAFEIRVVSLPQAPSTGGVALSDCKRRAEALLLARSSNRFVSLPEDVYAVDHQPSRVGALPSCSIVSVSKRLGPSLGDICYGIGENGMNSDGDDGAQLRDRRKSSRSLLSSTASSVAALTDTFTPKIISIQVLDRLLDCISKHVTIHLTLPLHGNITMQSVACAAPLQRATDLASADWVVTDWALDPRATESLAQPASPSGSPQRAHVSALERSRHVQKQWLRVLSTAFLGPEQGGRESGSKEMRHVVGMTKSRSSSSPRRKSSSSLLSTQPYLSVVKDDGSVVSRQELELMMIAAVTKGGVPLVALEDITSSKDDIGGLSSPRRHAVKDNQSTAKVSAGLFHSNTSDVDTMESLEERAYGHEVALTRERLEAALERNVRPQRHNDATEQFGDAASSPLRTRGDDGTRGTEYYTLMLPKRRPSPRRVVPDVVVAVDASPPPFRHSFALKRDAAQQQGAGGNQTPVARTPITSVFPSIFREPQAETLPQVVAFADGGLPSDAPPPPPIAVNDRTAAPASDTGVVVPPVYDDVVHSPAPNQVFVGGAASSVPRPSQKQPPQARGTKCCTMM